MVVSERQLKKKIDDWKIAKNVQSSEMTFIVHKQHQRTLARKPTTFRARGQPVNPDKIVRWQKRYGKSVEKIDSRECSNRIDHQASCSDMFKLFHSPHQI